MRILLSGLMLILSLTTVNAFAGVIESGDLNIIDQSGNASDGLRFLDMSFGDGRTQSNAIANAQAFYPDARLATPSEIDDLFTAAGIGSDSGFTPSDGYSSGGNVFLATGGNYDGGVLRDIIGRTSSSATLIWTDPDGLSSSSSTRDLIELTATSATIKQDTRQPADNIFGWVIVTDSGTPAAAVPEPSTWALLTLAGIGFGGYQMRRRKKAVQS